MRTWIFATIFILAALALSGWLHTRDWWGSDTSLTASAVTATPSESPLGVQVAGPITVEGTAIMDTSTGLPAVPYVRYEAEGKTLTKQLIFSDERGCIPGAGDIPCTPGYPQLSAYPALATGQRVLVSGYVRANRLLVTELSAT